MSPRKNYHKKNLTLSSKFNIKYKNNSFAKTTLQKIIITGSNGFLGSKLTKFFSGKYEVICGYNNNHNNISNNKKIKINYNNLENVKNYLESNKVFSIIHCAGLTNIEFCEENKSKCLEVNYKFTQKLVQISKKKKILFVFLSTDHLYDGKKKKYLEKDTTSPLNNYAISKIKSEHYIKKKLKKYLILRTNFFGFQKEYNKKNFFNFIFKSLSKKKEIKLFGDVYFSPVHYLTFCEILSKLMSIRKYGIFNISSDQRISKYKFGKLIAKYFSFKDNKIKNVSIDKIKNLVKRPKNMSLNNLVIKKTLKIKNINIINNIKRDLKIIND